MAVDAKWKRMSVKCIPFKSTAIEYCQKVALKVLQYQIQYWNLEILQYKQQYQNSFATTIAPVGTRNTAILTTLRLS